MSAPVDINKGLRERFEKWFSSDAREKWENWYNAKTNGQVRASCSEITARFLLSELEREKSEYDAGRDKFDYVEWYKVQTLLQSFVSLCEERQK